MQGCVGGAALGPLRPEPLSHRAPLLAVRRRRADVLDDVPRAAEGDDRDGPLAPRRAAGLTSLRVRDRRPRVRCTPLRGVAARRPRRLHTDAMGIIGMTAPAALGIAGLAGAWFDLVPAQAATLATCLLYALGARVGLLF